MDTTPYNLRFPRRYASVSEADDTETDETVSDSTSAQAGQIINNQHSETTVDQSGASISESHCLSPSDPVLPTEQLIANTPIMPCENRDVTDDSQTVPSTVGLSISSTTATTPTHAATTPFDAFRCSERPNETPPAFDLNALMQFLTIKFEESTIKINEKIDESNAKINETKLEIQNSHKILGNQINEIKSNQEKCCQEINEIKINQANQNDEIARLNSMIGIKIDESQNIMRKFVTDSMANQKIEIDNNTQKRHTDILNTVTNTLDQHKNDLDKKLEQLAQQTYNEIEQNTKSTTATIQNEILPKLQTQNILIEAQQNEIMNINTTLTKCENEVQNLKLHKSQFTNFPNTIQVTCTGNSVNDRLLPKFNGRTGNPNEYLRKLKHYFEKHIERNPQDDSTELLKDILETSFEGPASRWLQLIKHDIVNWEQFVNEFIEKYWSRAVQRGIKAKIESEKYRNNGTLSRSEYFTERVLLLQSITPALSEEEIVTLLSERFDSITQDSVSVQNITTIKAFERLLQREDIREGPRQNRNTNHSNNNNNSRPNFPNQNRSQDRNNINPRSYQPKMHNPNHQPYNKNQPYRSNPQYNNYQNHNYRPHHENKPYPREPSRNNNYNPNYQRYERPYPTAEQNQICAMIQQRTTAPQVSPRPINTAPETSQQAATPRVTQQENCPAL